MACTGAIWNSASGSARQIFSIPFVSTCGPCNIFSAQCSCLDDWCGLTRAWTDPEREYALNLRCDHNAGDNLGVHDERRVTECIIILSAEPGDNTENETYNGLPFEVENRWGDGVPRVGVFCTTYRTRRHGGSLALRLPLARALLMPGKGRYKGEKGKELFDPEENPEEFDEQAQDWEGEWALDADGSFLKKEELETRRRRAEAAAQGAVNEILAITKMHQDGASRSSKKAQQAAPSGQDELVAMSLKFLRQVKRPKAKRDALRSGSETVDHEADGALRSAAAEHRAQLAKKLSPASVRWNNLSRLVRSGGGSAATVALRAMRAAAEAHES